MIKKDKDEDIAVKIVINQFENEIARLNNTIKELNEDIDNLEDVNKENTNEIISLKNIIKGVREYIKEHSNNCMFELRIEELEELLEILGDDKEWNI